MGKFWFDGRCCTEFGMVASGSGTYNAPERDVEFISVEGRNGDLTIDKGRYKNIPISYPVAISKDFEKNAAAARAWLSPKVGYKRLEDDYHPGSYRMAVFAGPVDFDVKFRCSSGEATLKFYCKPQRYLYSGEHLVTYYSGGTIYNPTTEYALPIIMAYGSGAGIVTIGTASVEIIDMADVLILDCETMNAYRKVGDGASENKNNTISAPEFPQLAPGKNVVRFSGGITRVEIIPRWWTT